MADILGRSAITSFAEEKKLKSNIWQLFFPRLLVRTFVKRKEKVQQLVPDLRPLLVGGGGVHQGLNNQRDGLHSDR